MAAAGYFPSCKQSRRVLPASGVGGRLGLKRKHSMLVSEEDMSCSDEELSLATASRSPYGVLESKMIDYYSERPSKLKFVLNPYLTSYLQLFEDVLIQDFLWVDSCAKLADKYLLAMVYVYFRRADLSVKDYNKMNFFTALYLANDIEEDEEDEKYEIFPWALGKGWMTQFPAFLCHRDQLWQDMGFRAVVSRRTCEEVIAMAPHHKIWERQRLPYHGGAIRPYLRSVPHSYGRSSPEYCYHCVQALLGQRHNILPSTKLDFIDEIDLAFQRSSYIKGHHYQETKQDIFCHED